MKTFFEAKIWPFKNQLYRMVYLWVKDRDVAQDILQTVFERAWMQGSSLQKMDNPAGWLIKCAKNESLLHFRSSKKLVEFPEAEIAAQTSDEKNLSEEVGIVFRFMERLPEKQREVFHLREVEGLTYEEIADYLEISMEQVKVNLHRARKTLKEYLMARQDGR